MTVNTFFNPTPDASDSTTYDGDAFQLTASPRLHRTIESSEVQNSSGTAYTRTEMFYDYTATTGVVTYPIGNLTATESETDETTGLKVQTRYLTSGSYSYALSSNPYRANYSYNAGSESTMGWSRSKSDVSGRVVEAQTFSGSSLPAPWGSNSSSTGTVTTSYDAQFATVTDQAGKVRRSMTNGLAQLARVDEPDGSGSLGTTIGKSRSTLSHADCTNDRLCFRSVEKHVAMLRSQHAAKQAGNRYTSSDAQISPAFGGFFERSNYHQSSFTGSGVASWITLRSSTKTGMAGQISRARCRGIERFLVVGSFPACTP